MARLKLLLPLLGLLAILGPLGLQVGHFALVAHSRCADHGELVHDGSPRAHAHEHARESAKPPAVAVEQRDAHAEHDHCDALGCQVSPGSLTTPGSRLAKLPIPASPTGEIARSDDDVRTGLLQRAPKTSPPVALT